MDDSGTTEVNVPYPDAEAIHLRLSIGACRLQVKPGAGEAWVSGTYRDPTGRVPLRVLQEGGTVRITQGPDWGDFTRIFEGVPTFDLGIGSSKPFQLTIEGGASENRFDLSGLPITRLNLKHGAGRNELDFSAPNPARMESLEIGAGAGNLVARNLANSNAAHLRVDGGAAAFSLDFGGELSKDMEVRVSTGVSSVDISVPGSTRAKIYSESLLGGLRVGDGFTKQEGAFWTQGALVGEGPLLTIHTNVAVGSLSIKAT